MLSLAHYSYRVSAAAAYSIDCRIKWKVKIQQSRYSVNWRFRNPAIQRFRHSAVEWFSDLAIKWCSGLAFQQSSGAAIRHSAGQQSSVSGDSEGQHSSDSGDSAIQQFSETICDLRFAICDCDCDGDLCGAIRVCS